MLSIYSQGQGFLWPHRVTEMCSRTGAKQIGAARRRAPWAELAGLTQWWGEQKHIALDRNIRAEYWQHLLPLSWISFPRTFPSREAGSQLARSQRLHASHCHLLFQTSGEIVTQKENVGRGKYSMKALRRTFIWNSAQSQCDLLAGYPCPFQLWRVFKWISFAGVSMAKSVQEEFHSSLYRCYGEITPGGFGIRQDRAARRNS